MTKIMLCCSAGMSTSMLVKKMREAAESQGKEVEIEAFGATHFDEQVAGFDVVLLGPQVKYMLNDLKQRAAEYEVPVESISPVDYGTMNGAKVLDFALSLKA
ncbi:PTS sugar transporter subunit IIB [Endozoicomonas arenosclerae]|uniref:PTS sugar transporter subunit IIB n=1 Tax=Endozoicomonas arenosclerae TaxID=1633495 RepID=UPI000782817F|nr:PTS sugar transporter subunit IIB [Endozoicomonas arenosclerae]